MNDMRYRRRVQCMAVLGWSALLVACANQPTYQSAQSTTKTSITQKNIPQRYQVQSGDTVSKIAQRYGLDWRELSRINRLDSNHTIRVGQWLTLWEGGRASTATASAKNTASPSIATTAPRVITVKNPMVGSAGVMQFEYPVNKSNRVVRHFGEVANINGVDTKSEGMWFVGQGGDPIMASRTGTVIHVDNAKAGSVVSISHADGFVSSYLHVTDIRVKKGQSVNAGEHIAKMKQQNNGAVLMEFRIARDGVYIDPVTVLK